MTEGMFGLLIGQGTAVPLAGVEVQGVITGRAARVKIKQRYVNEKKVPVEAVYKFPLPEGCAICGFRALVGDRTITGSIEERDKAFQIYDDAMMRGDGAYLFDQERPNIFTLSVGNLNPGRSVIMEIEYVSQLEMHDGNVRFILPATIAPRYTPAALPDKDGIAQRDIVNPEFSMKVPYGMSIDLLIHSKETICGIESPSHTISTGFKDNKVTVSLTSERVAMDRDFILIIKYSEKSQVRAYCQEFAGEKFLQLDFTPGDRGGGATLGEVIFLLDCSGSMQGSSIEEARHALDIFLKGLQPGSYFNVYRFGSTFDKLYASSNVYRQDTIKAAIDYITKLQADLGGTEIYTPLKDILSVSPVEGKRRSVVIITDGQLSNESDIMDLAREHSAQSTIFVVGIGHAPNEYFIRGLARATHGTAEFIAPAEKIEPKVLRLFSKVVSGSVDEITINWGFDADQAPAVPVAYTGEAISVFTRLIKGKVPKTIDIKARFGKEINPLTTIVEDTLDAASPIYTCWAREKIRELEEGKLVGSQQVLRKGDANRKSVIEISKRYGLVCGETSYIAIEQREGDGKTKREAVLRKIPVMLAAGWHGTVPHNDIAAFSSWKHRAMPAATYSPPDSFTHGYRAFNSSNVNHAHFKLDNRLPSVKTPPSEDLMLHLLSLQMPDGGFKVSSRLLQTLELTSEQYDKVVKSIQLNGEVDRGLLLTTALVIAILRNKFPTDSSIWNSVVRKSEKWLDDNMHKAQPIIVGRKLTTWADDYVSGLDIAK
jgi:Ca-activated chloride channel family protein